MKVMVICRPLPGVFLASMTGHLPLHRSGLIGTETIELHPINI